MISAVANGRDSEAVAVEYVLDGEQSAAAVARGKSHLVGVAIAFRSVTPRYVTTTISMALAELGDRPRVYSNSIFGRTVERKFNLPTTTSFDDVGIMARLLELEPAAAPAAALRGAGGGSAHAGEDAVRRCVNSLQLLNTLPSQLSNAGLGYVYASIELPVVDPTVAMISYGVLANTAMLEENRCCGSVELDILRRQIAELAGEELNPDSPEKLRDFIFGKCRLPVVTLTDVGLPSTSGPVLQRLENLHPMIPLLRRYRKLRPILSATESLLQFASSSSIVHPELDPLGASTGRFSCEQPNLQGLPAPVCDAIRARDGCVLVEADFSQVELRVLAHFSRDPGFLDAYCGNDINIHRRTAALALGLPENAVTSTQRKIGKTVNFGIIYGQTEYGLSDKLNISVAEARQFIERYLRGYPKVAEWIEEIKQFVRLHGFVRTLYGRRRRLPEVWSPDRGKAEHALRQAVNSVVQGTAADLNKLALVRLHQVLPPQVRLLLTVHDSVLLEVPQEMCECVTNMVRQEMEAAPPNFTIPLRMDVKTGLTWGECKRQE